MEQPKKTVRIIPPTITVQDKVNEQYRQKRVVAYCRVSTKQEEQLNSYETQVTYYTEKINAEPNWCLIGIFADKGITGTSIKKRDEFNKMIRLCKKGKVDMIIVKSISRFARNTVDCLQHTRMLKKLGIDVYFEEQGIHSIEPGAEFYITIYGSIAQSESENISANVKWGKTQSAKDGNVPFHYKNFIGYRKGADGKPEINPEQAEIIKFIYKAFLMGDSLDSISKTLTSKGILTPKGKEKWSKATILSILTNEKYKGDAILNKTYIEDCLSKKVKKNNGERPKFYVENNHPAIIDATTFARVQEEVARRNSKQKVKMKGSKTEQGKYSSKYALTELLICGECKTPYRRCTWTVKGKKMIVWRCINRLDYGKKYCRNSPTIEESILHNAIANGIMRIANQDINVLKTLKTHIAMGMDVIDDEDESIGIQIKIAELDEEFKTLINSISNDNIESFNEERVKAIMDEKNNLKIQLARYEETKQKRKNAESRLDEIYDVIDNLKNHPIEYDDKIVRQLIEGIIVENKEQIKIIFMGGMTVVEKLN